MGKKRLETLFDLYAQNLVLVKERFNLKSIPDEGDFFACPICLKLLSHDELDVGTISEEHVPPEKLGGKVRTLTCTECNNRAGSGLESDLAKMLKPRDVFSGKPDAVLDVEYYINGEETLVLPATLSLSASGALTLLGDPKRTNPRDILKLYDVIAKEGISNFNLHFGLHRHRRPEAALLRIAYLWGFSVFGYGFLLNSNLAAIREQIQFPSKEILPIWGIAANHDFTDDMLGINIVTEPKELRSFLVVFDLVTKLGSTVRYGVTLPGLSDPGLGVYSFVESQNKLPMDVTMHLLPNNLNFIDDPFLIINYWNKLTR
jgi:hypothetical protein